MRFCDRSKNTVLMKISIVMLCLSAIPIVFVTFFDYKNGVSKVFSIIISVLFWIAIISGYLLLVVFYKQHRNEKIKGRIGAIRFFRNKYAFLSDVVMIISIFILITSAVLKIKTSFLYSLLIGIIFISANFHCIFNGRVFNRLIQKKRSGSNE